MERVFRSDETTTVETARGKIKGFFCDDLYIFKGIPTQGRSGSLSPSPWIPGRESWTPPLSVCMSAAYPGASFRGS